MKNRVASVSLSISLILISAIIISDLSKGSVAPDQLALVEGSYVNGKILYNTATHGGELLGYSSISIERIFTPEDTSEQFVQIHHSWEAEEGYFTPREFIEDQTLLELTYMVFYDNRTTFCLGKMFHSNETETIEINTMIGSTAEEIGHTDNTVITFKNGSNYLVKDIIPASPLYPIINPLFQEFLAFNDEIALNEYERMYAGVSPLTVEYDEVNYNFFVGEFLEGEVVEIDDGSSHNSMYVKFVNTFIFGCCESPEVFVNYESSTGLLIKAHETDGVSSWDFIPTEIVIDPVPTTFTNALGIWGIITSAAITVISVSYFKRKHSS